MKKKIVNSFLVVFLGCVLLSSCATKKKYGCPSHISISKIIGLLK